jgi:CDP-diacylglycerol--glycerol-3-phosphate 3-phosphatidyltransferase
MKRIPDLLSMSRIVLCLPLLLVDAMTVPFWVLYLIAGLTDMLDGFLARRWGVESKFGARLDSLADFVFVLVVGYKLFPWLKLPASLWMMIGFIALVKILNAISSYVIKHKIECLEQREPPNLFGWPSRDRQRHSQFLHTKANKLTGFLLFVGMMTVGQSYFIPVAWVIACIALFAAIQECNATLRPLG